MFIACRVPVTRTSARRLALQPRNQYLLGGTNKANKMCFRITSPGTPLAEKSRRRKHTHWCFCCAESPSVCGRWPASTHLSRKPPLCIGLIILRLHTLSAKCSQVSTGHPTHRYFWQTSTVQCVATHAFFNETRITRISS